MRIRGLALLLIGTVLVSSLLAQTPAADPVGTVAEIMGTILYPTGDAVFYISSRAPTTPAEWVALEQQTLMLAEAANLLTMPGRARDQDRWMKDAGLLRDAGRAAYAAAKARDVDALAALSEQLYLACVTCHVDYRPNFPGRRTRRRPSRVSGEAVRPDSARIWTVRARGHIL